MLALARARASRAALANVSFADGRAEALPAEGSGQDAVLASLSLMYVIDRADTAGANQQLTTIARFLNLHARHGVPRERLHAAAVVHGTGWMSLLSDSAYGARFGGKANPSRRMVEELLATNVQLVLCGQTAGFRGVKREELIPGVQLAISAMTALNVFQAQGYQYNPW